MWLQFILWSLLDGNTCTIHQEGEYEGVSNVTVGMSPLLSEHPDPWQGQEEVQSGCTRLAAHRGIDPGSTRQERDGNPRQCHPGWRIELPGERAAMHFSPSVKTAFLSPTFLQRTKPFLECTGLLCLTVKPHSPCTFFFLFILQLLCWSEEIGPVVFSHLGAFNWCWWWYFSIWQSTRWISYLPSPNFKAIHCTNCRSGQ